MIKVNKKKKKSIIKDILVSFVILVVVIVGVYKYTDVASAKNRLQGAQTLQEAIDHAIVQCYAIEGRYPPNVAYIEDNYGIQINFDKYNVFYDGFASNIKPTITVNIKSDDEPDWQQSSN